MKKSNSILMVIGALLVLHLNAYAGSGGGIDKVNDLFESLKDALFALGVVITTIAFMWAGFKVMFQGQTLREVATPLIGGVVVGSASAIAGFLF